MAPLRRGWGCLPVFHEPDIIEIDGQNAADTDDALQKAGVYETLGAVPTRNILLAHELYHFLAFRDGEGFTAQKHVTLWKLGRFAYKSSVPGLQEIAAMAFAQKATGLVCSRGCTMCSCWRRTTRSARWLCLKA